MPQWQGVIYFHIETFVTFGGATTRCRFFQRLHFSLAFMRLSILVLLAAFASPAFAAKPVAQKPAAAESDATFSRGGPLPKWAQTLADIPSTERTDPVVTRLAEIQVKAGATPSMLVNQAIQVNDPAALSEIGQYAINYFPSYQKVRLHRVAIIRAGQVMDRTSAVNVRLLEREAGVAVGVYDGGKSVQLLLDDVRIGDTLWVTYTTDGQNPVFGQRWAEEFSWDRGSPVELRRLTILHSPKQRIYWRQLGDAKGDAIEPVVDSVGELARMRFEGKGIEAVEFEPSIPPDYVPVRRLQFSEYPDWHAVALWADGLFPRVAASPALKQLATRFAAEKTQLAQASEALHWVQEEIRYFSVSIGQNSHRPQAPDTVLARRYGDCKDKSRLLVSLLAQLGIEAKPVLVNASAPKIPGKVIASPTSFDHAIVRIELDGAVYFVDPTRTGQKGLLTRLPPVLPGAMGLLVAADTQALLALPEDAAQFPLTEYIENIAIPSFDGDATLESRMIFRADYADWARRRYPTMSAAMLKKELLARYEKGYPGVKLMQTPKLVDDADGGRFEVVAQYSLPKPVIKEDGHYSIEYDSQIMEDTITIPAKVVRNFPYRLPQGKFRGRYRLSILWPAVVRAADVPVMRSIDNPFFFVSEEYTLRGNLVSYLLDYRLKGEQVDADAMPELSTQTKKLNPFASGRWRVTDANLALPLALGYSYRTFESVVDAQAIIEASEQMAKLKESEVDMAELCPLALRAVQLGEIATPSVAADLAALPAQLAKIDKPGARRCRARVLFAAGRFAESIPLFQAESALKDDDPLTPTLAWADFYAGDSKAALAEMARYRTARIKSGELNGFDIAGSIALLQRTGEPVPPELFAYGKEMPDGAWPRPLVAMQAGLIGEQALIDLVETLPPDARALALNEAWFAIGQRRLAANDKPGAVQAFSWFGPNGIRSTREYWIAKHERAQFESKDADFLAGVAAMRSNGSAAAVPKWRAAAGRGDAAGQYMMALVYFRGDGIKQDHAEAMRWARMAAEQGLPGAMNLLGTMYQDGVGVPRDSAQAYTWFRRAADQFDMDALHNMGNHYRYGRAPLSADPAKAFFYMRQSAELENADAQATIAGMYMDGEGVGVDDTQAFFWANRASRRGNLVGQRYLAMMYREGRGVKKDVALAEKMFRTAAEAGSASAMFDLGDMFERGDGVAKDPKLAFAWYEKAAKAGYAISELRIGLAYRDGAGVAADPVKAVMWMEKSASNEHLAAYIDLAAMFIDGKGVPKDQARGLAYLLKGAEAGDRFCQQNLAIRLHAGRGIEKNYAAAAEWYRKAIDQGMQTSRNNLADLYENGFGVPQDYPRAVSMYRQAAGAGFPMGVISLGSMYERGAGVAANPLMAFAYFQIAIRMMGGPGKDGETDARLAKVAQQLSASQRAEAEVLAAGWKPGGPFPGDSAK
jgi:TPR repeat protein/transglutaminase-like putative cysteine protease